MHIRCLITFVAVCTSVSAVPKPPSTDTDTQCLATSLSSHTAAALYAADCQNISERLLGREGSITLQPGGAPSSAFGFVSTQQMCKITVRNESSPPNQCAASESWNMLEVDYAVIGLSAQETLKSCKVEASGWRTVGSNTRLVVIVQPFQDAPPSYVQRCSS